MSFFVTIKLFLFFFREICTDKFFVVSDVDVFVGEGGMGPAGASVKLPPLLFSCYLVE